MNSNTRNRILVLGVGNLLLKDEGVGVHIANELQKQNLGENVEIIDGGTASLDIFVSNEDVEKLVVVDAMKAGKEPGTIYRADFDAKDKKKLEDVFAGNNTLKTSLHQIGLIDALAAAEKMNCAPKKITIIGVEPKEIDYGLELTKEVEKVIPKIINTVLEEIKDAVHKR